MVFCIKFIIMSLQYRRGNKRIKNASESWFLKGRVTLNAILVNTQRALECQTLAPYLGKDEV